MRNRNGETEKRLQTKRIEPHKLHSSQAYPPTWKADMSFHKPISPVVKARWGSCLGIQSASRRRRARRCACIGMEISSNSARSTQSPKRKSNPWTFVMKWVAVSCVEHEDNQIAGNPVSHAHLLGQHRQNVFFPVSSDA